MTPASRMRRSELAALSITIGWAVMSFLPVWREPEIGGVSVFGWLMATLMVLSPILALLALRGGRR